MNTAQGQCLCGAIQFTAHLPSLWVAHCHCTRCQRAHGAAFVTWVGLLKNRVYIHDPQLRLQWYAFINQDKQTSQRGFCNRCGSPLFFCSEQHPNEIHIARALFTSAVDRLPESHDHYDSHVDWVHISTPLPTE